MTSRAAVVAATLAPGAAIDVGGERPYGLAPEGAAGFRPALAHLRGSGALLRQLDDGCADLRIPRRDIPATFIAQLYAWALAAPMAAALLATARVPALHPAAVAIAPGRGTRAPAFGQLGGTTIALLPGDAAAGTPGTRTVGGRAALVRVLWEAVEAHLDLLVPFLSRASGRPEAALWRVGHDAVASAVTGLGERWDRTAAWALWEEARGLAPARLAGGARPVLVEVEGTEEAVLERAGCCLAYRCPAFPQPCVGCPLTPPAERPARLAAARHRAAAAG